MRCNGSNWAVYSPRELRWFQEWCMSLMSRGNNAPWAPLSWWIRALYKSTYYYYYYYYILIGSSLNIVDGFEISKNPDIHISGMYLGEQGVWITVRGSCIIMLWDVIQLQCVLMHDTSNDQTPILKKVCEQKMRSFHFILFIHFIHFISPVLQYKNHNGQVCTHDFW